MAKAPFSQEEYNKALDIAQEEGEEGYRYGTQQHPPYLDERDLGGYTGEGAKTVILQKRTRRFRAWFHTRARRDHPIVHRSLRGIAPNSVKIKVTPHHGGEPYVSPTDTAEYQAASKAMETTFGKRPIPVRSGGSIPIVALFERELNAKSILFGFGLDSDAIHSPNEHYGLFNFFKGIETIPYFYSYYNEKKQISKPFF